MRFLWAAVMSPSVLVARCVSVTATEPVVHVDENARLKKRLAEAMLDNAMLKDVASKNGEARREAEGCRSSAVGIRGERASGVPCAAGGPHGSALPEQSAMGHSHRSRGRFYCVKSGCYAIVNGERVTEINADQCVE